MWPPPESPQETMKKRSNITIIFAIVLLVVIGAVVIVGVSQPTTVETIQGEVEMSTYRVSSKVPGRVCEIRVEEGDAVRKGDTLLILEAPDVMAKYNQASAALSAARAVESKALSGARSEQVNAAYEMWQQARAGYNVAKKTYDRVAKLYADSVVSEQKRDEAKAQMEAREAQERAAKSQYDMAVNGAQDEDKQAAHAQVERALSAVSEVDAYVDELKLTALDDGQVGEIYPELGELVGTGAPLMSVAMTDKVWFTFNVREDLLPGLAVGVEQKAYIPAIDRQIDIRVTNIRDVGSYAVWKATKALDKYDLKTFELKAVPLHPDSLQGLLRAGMSVIISR